jgi:hypothetical protein
LIPRIDRMLPPGLIGIVIAITSVVMSWLNHYEASDVSTEKAKRKPKQPEMPPDFPRLPRAFVGNTISLNDARADRRVPRLEYDPETHYWTTVVWSVEMGGIEICIHGTSAGPDLERFLMVEPVLRALELLASLAQHDLNVSFSSKTPPLGGWPLDNPLAIQFREEFEKGFDPEDTWEFFSVYFGFVGNEPLDEFSVHFGLGIDWGASYYAQYRLDSETPNQSMFLGWSREDWLERPDL